MAKLRQEVTDAKDALVKKVREAALRKAVEAAEVHNLNEVIGSLIDQNVEGVAEAKEDFNKEPEEMEVEFCRSLVDDCHHSFKDLSDLKSWYALEEYVQHGISIKSVESNPLRSFIISFRGQHLPELKSLGAHLKYAMVASVSAYTKLIEDSLQEKENLKDEISNLQKKNFELCHQMVTTEKRLMDVKIQSEANLRAKEDVLSRNLKEISQSYEQKISEMRERYELIRKEFLSLETVKAEQASQRSIQETKMKASNESRPKRLKSSDATNSSGGDGISVPVTTNKGKRPSRAKTADTNNGRQNFNRRGKDKNPVVEQEDPQSEGLPQTKRSTSSNKKSRPALQQSRAKESPSPDQLVDLTFIDSLLDTFEDQNDDPYAF